MLSSATHAPLCSCEMKACSAEREREETGSKVKRLLINVAMLLT